MSLASMFEVAKGYALVGASYAKSTAKAVVGTVRGEKDEFKVEIVRCGPDGKPLQPKAAPKPPAAAPKPIAKPQPVAAKPVEKAPVAEVKQAEPPVVVEAKIVEPSKPLEIVEAELVSPTEAKAITEKMDELTRQSNDMRAALKPQPGVIIRKRALV